MSPQSWIELKQDAETGIETIRAHFEGHAYDPHWHDSFLVGYTEQGIQQFQCRRQIQRSVPGKVFTLEPGEVHDGYAVAPEGFTYSMLYLDAQWMERELRALFDDAPTQCQPAFAQTLHDDAPMTAAIGHAFAALQQPELRIVRQSAIDALLARLTAHLHWRRQRTTDPRLPLVAQRARDFLHDHLDQDIGLDDVAQAGDVDRYRLTRAFKAAYGLAPHAYLVQLRLSRARHLLARGVTAAEVAATLGFADQSHLGRWFRRAYGMTPADYRKRCSNLPDA